MAYSAKAVANYFLDRAVAADEPISPMKLQKLVYYAHGWNLALRGEPLIDEQIEAWRFGPVVRSVYHAFKEFGNQPIQDKAIRLRRDSDFRIVMSEPSIDQEAEDDRNARTTKRLLDRVWEVYGGYSAIQLSNMTHADGTPWHQVREGYSGKIPKGTDIPQESIAKFFVEMK